MKILLLTRYDRLGASSRLRALQYLPYFQSLGWQVDPVPFFSQAYLRNLYAAQSVWKEVLLAYLRRFKALTKAGGYDLVWIEKEVLPFFPAVAERLLSALRIPYMVDYDDALFHKYDLHRLWPVRAVLGRKIDAVMRHASLVVAGNEYLAERARNAGARKVEIVPTVIDLDRYPAPAPQGETTDRPLIVGWIGTPKTSRYLHPLKPVFASLKPGSMSGLSLSVPAGKAWATCLLNHGSGPKRQRWNPYVSSTSASCPSMIRHGSAGSAATSSFSTWPAACRWWLRLLG